MVVKTKSDRHLIADQIQVLSIAEGFYQSSVLFALLRLDLFKRIGESGQSLHDLASEVGAQEETLRRLLNAGVMIKLLETEDGEFYRLAPVSRSVLLPSSENESFLGHWLELLDEFMDASSRLDQAVLENKPTKNPSSFFGGDESQTRKYTLAMHGYAALRGKELAHFLDTCRCSSMLDVGCGPGTFAFHLGLRNPKMRICLADFPQVLRTAKEVQTQYALENEITYIPFDAERDEIPGSYDLILASNVLQCFDASRRARLLDRIYEALNPNGSLVVQAQFLQEDHLGGRWAVYVDLNLLCSTVDGRNHTVEETKAWLLDAGFVDIQHCPMSIYGTTSFVRAFKRGSNELGQS